MTTTVAAATARALAAAGVDRVFGLPGGEVLVLIDELRRAGVEFVLMRHEANAGLAAAVYGKLRRQPGVVLATLGPGAANLLLPLANASLDQEPLLALSAQIAADAPISHTHQRLPLHELYRPVTRLVDTITAVNATVVVTHALAACMIRPYSTAYLTLSAREALATVADAGAGDGVERPALQHDSVVSSDDELIRALGNASRPLVAIGLGVDTRNAARIRRWIDAWRLPVVVTPKVKGIVDETSPHFVGVIGGMAADSLMCDALAASDCLIGFGLDPVEIDKTWHAELAIHWVLEAPNVGGLVPPGVALVEHARWLDALVGQPPPARWETPFRAFQEKRRAMLSSPSAASRSLDRKHMWPGAVVTTLASQLPPDTIVTTDVGSHKYLFGQFWPCRQPDTFWMSNGLSGMGYGLSAAIGAKLARPDAPVLAVVGDGGFSMNGQELETAERVGARFVTIVIEDGSYSLIKLSQQGKKLRPYGVEFGPIDTVKMAQSCGVDALRTASPEELAAAVRRAVDSKRSLVVGVPVDDAEYVPLF